MRQMKVGIFDSGVGGLTVAKSVLSAGLFEEAIYYGDTARAPYGIKDENTIIRYALEAIEFFKNFSIDMLIVACNTVSACAIEEMQKNAPFEIVGVIEPGVMSVLKQNPPKGAPILVIGTQATIQNGVYQQALFANGFTHITALATGLFVPLVEEGIVSGPLLDAAMEHYFHGLKEPSIIILGCTHFPIIAPAIGAKFPNAVLVHSGNAIVDILKTKYNLVEKTNKTDLKLFASSVPERLKMTAKYWLHGVA
jgi:glutamate racemase